MDYHQSVISQLVESTSGLSGLFTDPGLETKLYDRFLQLQQLINDTKATHRRLLQASEHWNEFRKFASLIDPWLKEANVQLLMLLSKAERGRLSHEDSLQYWVSLNLFAMHLSSKL